MNGQQVYEMLGNFNGGDTDLKDYELLVQIGDGEPREVVGARLACDLVGDEFKNQIILRTPPIARPRADLGAEKKANERKPPRQKAGTFDEPAGLEAA